MSENAWIFVIGTAVTQITILVGVYVRIQGDLTAIKTRLKIDDESKAERAEAKGLAMRVALDDHCKGCPVRQEHDRWAAVSRVEGPGGA